MGCTASSAGQATPGTIAISSAEPDATPVETAEAANEPTAAEAEGEKEAVPDTEAPAAAEKQQETDVEAASPKENLLEPLLGQPTESETSDDPRDDSQEARTPEEQTPTPPPPPALRISCWAWARLTVVWLCCTLAVGFSPGQAVFVSMFAKAGVFGGECDDKDGVPCDQQVAQLSMMFQMGLMVGSMAVIINGMLFDIYGGRPMGTGGAVLVFVGLLLEAVAIFSALNGMDAYTNWLVIVASIITDFGSMTNSYCFFGLIWHYPGSTTLILSLSNATYQVSALLPVLLQWIMDMTGIHLGYAMLLFAGSVLATTPVIHAFTPSQQEYYHQAKVVLGVPIPKPKATFEVCTRIRMAWKAVRADMGDHMFLCLGFAFSSALASLYNSMSWAYGKSLFGHQEDGDRLAQIQVMTTAIVGAVCAPVIAKVMDCIGLNAFLRVLTLFICAPAALFYVPEWWAAWVTTFGYCLFTTLSTLFMCRYLLHYAPPNRFGTYTVVWTMVIMFVMLPAYGVANGVIMVMPEEQRFFMPFVALSVVSVLFMVIFNIRFCFNHGGRGVPATPHMLPEDELELCMPFGALNLDDASEITGLEKEVLLARIADPDPQSIRELMTLLNPEKVAEVFAKHDEDDFVRMLEVAPELAQEDQAAGPDSERQPLLLAVDSPRPSGGAAERGGAEAGGVEAQVDVELAQKLAKDFREAFRLSGSEERKEALQRASRECGAGVRARALSECLYSIGFEGDTAGWRRFLLEVPGEDLSVCFATIQDSEARQNRNDWFRKFEKEFPPKELAALMKQNRELKSIMVRLMKRQIQKTVESLQGRFRRRLSLS